MIQIYYQDDNFCVVEKPTNVLSVPSRQGRSDDRPVLGILLQQQLGKKIFPVHRLDYEVGGIMVFALNPNSHRFASRQWEQGQVTKTYQAISEGPAKYSIGPKSGKWASKLVRGKKRTFAADYGKDSLTEYSLLEQKPCVTRPENVYTLWELKPVTGRSHQLRYELSHRENPILGDTLYGSRQNFDGIALRAVEIEFQDVSPQDEAVYFSKMPKKFKSIVGLQEVFKAL